MTGRDLRDLLDHRAELDVGQCCVPVRAEQVAELALERLRVVGCRRRAAEHQHHVGEERDVLLPEREQEQHDQLAHLRRHLADHAEVEEVDALLPPEQVPRVRVGVEEAVREDLVVVRLDQLAGGLLALAAGRRLAQRHALDVLHDEQPRRRVRVVERAARRAGRTGSSTSRSRSMFARLDAEVELAAQRAATGARRRRGCRRPRGRRRARRPARRRARAARRRAGSRRSRSAAAPSRRPARRPRAARGAPGRSSRRRSAAGRCFSNTSSHGTPSSSSMTSTTSLLGERRHLVLERRELLDVLGRQQVGPRREDLAELRERRAELLERLAQVARADRVRLVAAPLAQPVARHDHADARRAPEQAGGQLLAVGHRDPSAVLTITTVQPARVRDAVRDVAEQERLASAHADAADDDHVGALALDRRDDRVGRVLARRRPVRSRPGATPAA